MPALPPAHPPNAAALHIAWPLPGGEASVSPGAILTVPVAPAERTLRLSLVRVTQAGAPMRVIARRTLRSGAFEVRVPGRQDAVYALVVETPGRRWFSWAVARYGPQDCFNRRAGAAALTLEPDRGPPGSVIQMVIANTGRTCLSFGAGYEWQRLLEDGTWQAVPTPPGYAIPLWARLLPPGDTATVGATVWPDMAPGAYRLAKEVGALTLYAPFTVTSG